MVGNVFLVWSTVNGRWLGTTPLGAGLRQPIRRIFGLAPGNEPCGPAARLRIYFAPIEDEL